LTLGLGLVSFVAVAGKMTKQKVVLAGGAGKRGLRLNNHALTVVKDDTEVVSDLPTKDCLIPKHGDRRIEWLSVTDLDSSLVDGSSYSPPICNSPDSVSIRWCAIANKASGNDQGASETSINERLKLLAPIPNSHRDKEVGEAGSYCVASVHNHSPTASSPTLKM